MRDGIGPNRVAELAELCGGRVLNTRKMANGEHIQTTSFPSHMAKIRFFAQLGAEHAKDQDLQALSRSIVGEARDKSQLGRIAAVHEWVRDNVTHIGEPIETVPDPVQLAWDGCGDCDDVTVLLIALLKAIGERAGFAWLGDPPRHAYAVVFYQGQWWPLEATIDALAGEHPLDAAQRLGIIKRKDITK